MLDEDFHICLDVFATNLLRRGYTKLFLDPIFIANRDNDRQDLITNRIRKNDNKIVKCIIPSQPPTLYVTNSNTTNQIINTNLLLPSPHFQQSVCDYRYILDEIPRVICRNRPNLFLLLTCRSSTKSITIPTSIIPTPIIPTPKNLVINLTSFIS
jgi:hypothetical protein